MRSFYFLFFVVFFAACSTGHQKSGNVFSNEEMVNLHQMIDERRGEAMLEFLQSENKLVRIAALDGAASIRDESIVPQLNDYLKDQDVDIRWHAAYALGQCGSAEAILPLTVAARKENAPEALGAMLEALGKLTPQALKMEGLTDSIFWVFNELPISGMEAKVGYGKGLMWRHYAGVYSPELLTRCKYFLQDSQNEDRVSLARAISSYKGTWLQTNEAYITEWAQVERNTDAKVYIMMILGKVQSENARKLLVANANAPSAEPAVVRAAINALRAYDDTRVSELMGVFESDSEKVLEVALSAVDRFKRDDSSHAIWDLLAHRSERIKALAAAVTYDKDDSFALEKMKEGLAVAKTDSEKAAWIGVYKKNPAAWNEVLNWITEDHAPVITYSAANVLYHFFEEKRIPEQVNYWRNILVPAFAKKDPGVVSLLCATIPDASLSEADKKEADAWMSSHLKELKLPKDMEVAVELSKAINELGFQKVELPRPSYNHPIDWELVKSIPSNQKVEVLTDKGAIIIELDINHSPGSVSNFIQLVRDGYFNNRTFHRVVPDFVVQSGCDRGDGMGSLDYTIRSEFALHDYKKGAVGLASVGPDTESSQFFISTFYTATLEGRYTIFGYVDPGYLHILDQIEIGDKMISIKEIES